MITQPKSEFPIFPTFVVLIICTNHMAVNYVLPCSIIS